MPQRRPRKKQLFQGAAASPKKTPPHGAQQTTPERVDVTPTGFTPAQTPSSGTGAGGVGDGGAEAATPSPQQQPGVLSPAGSGAGMQGAVAPVTDQLLEIRGEGAAGHGQRSHSHGPRSI